MAYGTVNVPGKLTAKDVGARPDDWMPTAEDVGAVAKTGDTMSGNLYVAQESIPRMGVRRTDGKGLDLRVTTAGNMGLYDLEADEFILYKNTKGEAFFYGSADTLATPRKIGGVDFDGSKDITLDEMMAYGFKRAVTASDKMDDLTETGFYYFAGGNAPIGCPVTAISVIEVVNANGRIVQRVSRVGASGVHYIRVRESGGTWYDWVSLVTSARTINGKSLASNINLTASDVGIFYADKLPSTGMDGQICLVPVS